MRCANKLLWANPPVSNRSHPIRAVALDLDGTLLDSGPDLVDATNGMRVALGLAPLRPDVILTFVGKGAENLVRRALHGSLEDAGEMDPAQIAEAMAAFRHHYHLVNGNKTRVFDGVLEGLRDMRAQGLKLAVVTNKPAEFTLPLLAHTGLRALFDAVVSGDTCTHKKPDPEPVLHACALMDVPAEETVMIGDSVNDTLAGRAAGTRVLVVPYGYNEGRDVRTLETDALVASIMEASLWIRSVQPPAS